MTRSTGSTQLLARIESAELVKHTGSVTKIFPTFLEADGPSLPLGALCRIETGRPVDLADPMLASVVSVGRDAIRLVPFTHGAATYVGARIVAQTAQDLVPVGDALMGRAIDGLARPIDGAGPIESECHVGLGGMSTPPMTRTSPKRPIETGIRAIDGLLTLGQGQRIGIFAAAGVGKTSLMTQMANQVAADRCVICLVGERGREVEALWSGGLSDVAKAKSVLVAATSDQTAAMRARAGAYALALADRWRQEGHQVLLVFDSITRLAMALREIGLAGGEPPTVRAYTPSVFSVIPQMVERCGALRTGGSITAVFTVLSETDEVDDPISEMMKSLLDGHIILSRDLAEQGHFPAIDVPRSVSRLALGLVTATHRESAEAFLAGLSIYDKSRTLIETGIYARGTNPLIDAAIERRPALLDFLRQRSSERVGFDASRRALSDAVRGQA